MEDLEDKFELTRRTLFRDIRALIDGGLPIGGNAGEGYFIVDGYHLPPVVFNKQEAAAILMGAKFIEHQADTETSESFQQALTKVKAVLRYTDKEFVDELEKRVTIIPDRSPEQGFPDSHLGQIQLAIAANKTLQLDYFSNYNGEVTKREVHPLGLVYYSNRWHLVAYCLLREDLRDFRTDRIQKISVTPTSFDPLQHADYLSFVNRTVMGTEAHEVIVQFDKRIARFTTNQRYLYGFVEEKDLGDVIEMRFLTPSYEYFGRWLLTYTDSVNVISPDRMITTMNRFIEELSRVYKKTPA